MRAISILFLSLAVGAGLFSQGPNPKKAAVFFAEGFPAADAPAPSKATLENALARAAASGSALRAEWAQNIGSLVSQLQDDSTSLLVLPYGSAFPVDAWPQIKNFLGRGGNLLVLGGAPFHQPVRFDNGKWVIGFRQPTFANQLLIGPAEEISVKRDWSPEKNSTLKINQTPKHTWSLTVRFASTKDFPDEDGGAGVREAISRPLARIADGQGVPRACAAQEIDRLRGEWVGGRWVFATTDAELKAEEISQLIARAASGPCEFEARILQACIELGEKPHVRVLLRRPVIGESAPLSVKFKLLDSAGNIKGQQQRELGGSASLRTADAIFDVTKPLAPGLYTVTAELMGASYQVPIAETGVWVKDAKLLQTGPKVTAGRDWLRWDGKATPVVGTTYMDSQIHRKFLFEPNPARWNRDFAAMKKAGINYVRTGIWTGWPRISLEPGSIDENVLRALDAYVQCAANNGIHVCFTFFAFLPLAAPGDNPYLSPRALELQKSLITLIAGRFKGSPWIHYDLINEPSYSTLAQLWNTRPIGDALERTAWRAYLSKKFGGDRASLADIFRDGGDPFAVPTNRDFAYSTIRLSRVPRKAAEFYLFANEVVANWASDLRETIRRAGGDVMVTLGQDEGGTGGRAAPPFFGHAVDYTTVHSWWNNDDILWDSLATKIPDKPCLVQETGLMRLEDKDGLPWRGIEGSAALLERKFALALLGRSAGAVQWAWNINTDMDNDNEVVIGLFRPDGTAKPEYDVVRSFGAFAASAAKYIEDWGEDEVAILIPHRRMWQGRPKADDGTRRLVKLLADRFGIAGRMISDQTCNDEALKGIKLAIVPTCEMLELAAEMALKRMSGAGGLVVLMGPLEGDAFGRPLTALKGLEGQRPLFNREETPWGWATFDQTLNQALKAGASTFDPESAQKSNVWHIGLPLDYAREETPLVELLGRALLKVGIKAEFRERPATARALKNTRAILVGVVSESSTEVSHTFSFENFSTTLKAKPGRCSLALLDATTGAMLAAYALPDID